MLPSEVTALMSRYELQCNVPELPVPDNSARLCTALSGAVKPHLLWSFKVQGVEVSCHEIWSPVVVCVTEYGDLVTVGILIFNIHTSMRRWIENAILTVLVAIMVIMAMILIHNVWVYGWMY